MNSAALERESSKDKRRGAVTCCERMPDIDRPCVFVSLNASHFTPKTHQWLLTDTFRRQQYFFQMKYGRNDCFFFRLM